MKNPTMYELKKIARKNKIQKVDKKNKIELMESLGMNTSNVCRNCGRALTDPESVKLGIGPICRRKASVSMISTENKNKGTKEHNDYPTLTEYSKEARNYMIKQGNHKKCMCGKPVIDGYVEHYEHDGGWYVKGYKNKQWLYFECPNCHYQYSFQHAGVRRPYGNQLK